MGILAIFPASAGDVNGVSQQCSPATPGCVFSELQDPPDNQEALQGKTLTPCMTCTIGHHSQPPRPYLHIKRPYFTAPPRLLVLSCPRHVQKLQHRSWPVGHEERPRSRNSDA
jgi:hypothetical protein